jgi:hypothetical protein
MTQVMWRAILYGVLVLFPGGMGCFAGVVSISIGSSSEVRSLPPYYWGQNADLVWGGSWRDSRYPKAFRKLHTEHVRFPAGTTANYWDWKRGWLVDSADIPYGMDKVSPNYYYISDLKILYDADGTVPVFVLNMLTSDLENQLEMLREARRIGLPVKFVEMGNEFYLSKSDNIQRFPTCEAYATCANAWALAVRHEFPDVKIAAVGAAVRSSDDARRKTWNQTLFPLLKGIDAVTIHVYSGAELLKEVDTVLEGVGLVSATASPVQQKIKPTDGRPGFWAADEEQLRQLDKLHTDWGVARTLGMPAQRWSQMHDLDGLPKGMEAWLTEYGLFDRIGPVRHTWANGLFIASLSLQSLDVPQITMATYHCTFDHPMFAAIYGENNAFKYLVESPLIPERPVSVPFDMTPSGMALSLIGRASAGMTAVSTLDFSENVTVSDGNVYPYKALYGKLFFSEGRKRCLLLNLSNVEFDVNVNTLFPDSCLAEQVFLRSPQSYGRGESDYLKELKRVSGLVHLRPYSMTLIQL